MKPVFRTLCWVLLAFSAPLTNPSFAMAQDVQVWENVGLYGGYVYDIAIDRSNPDKMFAGTYMGDGLYVTFQVINQAEQPLSGVFVNATRLINGIQTIFSSPFVSVLIPYTEDRLL